MVNFDIICHGVAMNTSMLKAIMDLNMLGSDDIEQYKLHALSDTPEQFKSRIEQISGERYEQILIESKRIYQNKIKSQKLTNYDYIQKYNEYGEYVGLIPANDAIKNDQIIKPVHLKLDNYIENAQAFHSEQPYFYDDNGVFWFWHQTEKRWRIVDEIDLINSFDDLLGFVGQTVASGVKRNYLEAFKRVGRQNKPIDAPKSWVQFKDQIYCIQNRETYTAAPTHWFCNPIPWSIGNSDDTPMMDKLFAEWVGDEYVQTLYEIIAYGCYPDYPIQLLFCLYGNGRNGKSCFLKLITKFFGMHNTGSTELDMLIGNQSSRFESIKLYKKLVCLLGETNFQTLSRSSILKKLTGGDPIGFEMKGKQPFDDYNYAKIIIASNSLPITDDTSEGYYRRWVIIDFPNQFNEGIDILSTIPDMEYENLAKKITKILPELITRGSFTNQGTVEDRKRRYIMASNPLSEFIHKHCKQGPNEYALYSEMFIEYVRYLSRIKRRAINKREFSKVLQGEGFEVRKTWKRKDLDSEMISGYWVEGVSLREIIPSDIPIKGESLRILILDYIGDSIVKIADIENQFFKDAPYACDPMLTKLRSDGDIFECRPGEYQRLK